MGEYPRHRSYRAYRGSSGPRRRLPRFIRVLLILLLCAALTLGGTAVYLQRYMVYSTTGGHLVLPGRDSSDAVDDDTSIDLSTVVQETARRSGTSGAKK